ncbi:MAG: DUF29 domain-containing protein, partial [Acetobacteraceae bacterium]
MADLYEDDILLWSERQGELLRRRAAGELVNEADLDWPNIAEEIESVGRSELRSCSSLLEQALLHMLKGWAWPRSRDAPAWHSDAILLRHQATDAFAESMRQRLNIQRIYRRALRALPKSVDGLPPLPVPERCPVTL